MAGITSGSGWQARRAASRFMMQLFVFFVLLSAAPRSRADPPPGARDAERFTADPPDAAAGALLRELAPPPAGPHAPPHYEPEGDPPSSWPWTIAGLACLGMVATSAWAAWERRRGRIAVEELSRI